MNSIKKQSVIPRIDGIQRDINKLKELGKLPYNEFSKEDNFIKAQFFLRQALEGVFHIGSHILSRIPGGRATEYKEIAQKMGETGVVDRKFAETSLTNMAGYRNRLTHFYAAVKPEEVFRIIQNNLGDFGTFLSCIKKIMEHPEKLDLSIE